MITTHVIITFDELVSLSKLLEKYNDLLKSERNDVLNKWSSIECKCIKYSTIMDEMKKVSHVEREIKDRIAEMLENQVLHFSKGEQNNDNKII